MTHSYRFQNKANAHLQVGSYEGGHTPDMHHMPGIPDAREREVPERVVLETLNQTDQGRFGIRDAGEPRGQRPRGGHRSIVNEMLQATATPHSHLEILKILKS